MRRFVRIWMRLLRHHSPRALAAYDARSRRRRTQSLAHGRASCVWHSGSVFVTLQEEIVWAAGGFCGSLHWDMHTLALFDFCSSVSKWHRRGTANNPAAGKAGIARPLTIEHHCPGLPEPGRFDKMTTL